jgi:hypothetical protein
MKQTFIKYLTDSGMLSQVQYEIWWSTGMSFDEYLDRTNPIDYMTSFLYPNTPEYFKLATGWLKICFDEYLLSIAD